MNDNEKKEVVKNWLERNQFFNVETNESIFMVADGISHRLVVMLESEENEHFHLEDIKMKTLRSGRQLWKAHVEEKDISWEIL
ncbi:hypothetical protein [Flavobacterium soli]|uniref:hypothetical protein n=1 Tax=Flavobacterium soli TaxID=344881 RepID=UPI0003FA20BC|nr:hypothetical protein [Flavobacterium soli]